MLFFLNFFFRIDFNRNRTYRSQETNAPASTSEPSLPPTDLVDMPPPLTTTPVATEDSSSLIVAFITFNETSKTNMKTKRKPN